MISRLLQIWKNVANIRFMMGPPRLLQVIEIYYNITWGGGLPNLLQYYNGGGSLGTPNLYYVIYGRPSEIREQW